MDSSELDILRGFADIRPEEPRASLRKASGLRAPSLICLLSYLKMDDTNAPGLVLIIVIILGTFPDVGRKYSITELSIIALFKIYSELLRKFPGRRMSGGTYGDERAAGNERVYKRLSVTCFLPFITIIKITSQSAFL